MPNWIRKLRGQPPKPCHVSHQEIRPEDRAGLTQDLNFCKKCKTPYLTEPRMTTSAMREAAAQG